MKNKQRGKKHRRTHTDCTSLLQEIRSLMKRFLETSRLHSSKKEIKYSIKFFSNLPFKKKNTWCIPFIDLASAPWKGILSGFLLRATEISAQCSVRLLTARSHSKWTTKQLLSPDRSSSCTEADILSDHPKSISYRSYGSGLVSVTQLLGEQSLKPFCDLGGS